MGTRRAGRLDSRGRKTVAYRFYFSSRDRQKNMANLQHVKHVVALAMFLIFFFFNFFFTKNMPLLFARTVFPERASAAASPLTTCNFAVF